MAENKFVLKELSTYTGKTNILYQKEFETKEQAERYRTIIEPLLREIQANNPALPYVKFVIDEL